MSEKDKEAADFDFDRWSEMAQQDPEKFEAMRQQLINDLIAQAPCHIKQRMTGLQWQVDQIRQQAGNPMAACLQISKKMWDQVLGDKGLLQALQQPKQFLNTVQNDQTGQVFSFEKYKATKRS